MKSVPELKLALRAKGCRGNWISDASKGALESALSALDAGKSTAEAEAIARSIDTPVTGPAPATTPADPRIPEPLPVASSSGTSREEMLRALLGSGEDAEARRLANECAKRLGDLASAVDRVDTALDGLRTEALAKATADTVKTGDLADAVKAVLADALAAVPEPRRKAAVARAVASAAPAGSILGRLAERYAPGRESDSITCITSPPSFGKTHAARQLGSGYDVFLAHGCSPDLDEVSTLLGTVAPDGKGGFLTVDGVVTQAFRAAASGKNTLLFLDEVFRLAPRCQEWLLTVVTAFHNAAGELTYRLRTRRVVEGGAVPELETIEAPACRLHWLVAGNLAHPPVEAFWSRFDTLRIEFSGTLATAIARSIIAEHRPTDAVRDIELAASKVAACLVQGRAEVKSGVLQYPPDFRMLVRGLRETASLPEALQAMARALPDQCARWDADTGDVIGPSVVACGRLASILTA